MQSRGDGVTISRVSRMRGRRGVCAALLGVVAVASAACSGDEPLTTPDGSPISTTVTRVAEVNIVSPDRDFSKTCLAPTAADAGTADAGRIVVTDPSLLDALCALGIGDKVVELDFSSLVRLDDPAGSRQRVRGATVEAAVHNVLEMLVEH